MAKLLAVLLLFSIFKTISSNDSITCAHSQSDSLFEPLNKTCNGSICFNVSISKEFYIEEFSSKYGCIEEIDDILGCTNNWKTSSNVLPMQEGSKFTVCFCKHHLCNAVQHGRTTNKMEKERDKIIGPTVITIIIGSGIVLYMIALLAIWNCDNNWV